MDMKRGGYQIKIFKKVFYKLNNITDQKTKAGMAEAKSLEVLLQYAKKNKDKKL